MYSKSFGYKDFADKPRNETVFFNLSEREVFKLLPELQMILTWQESMRGPLRELETGEVVEFYTAFENILLSSYGVPSDDGRLFRKAGRYEFEESALFNAIMVEMVSNPEETAKLMDGIMPKGLQEVVKTADVNLAKIENNPETTEELRREVERLRAQAAEATAANPVQ